MTTPSTGPKMGTTLMGQAIKFATRSAPEAGPSAPAGAAAPRRSVPVRIGSSVHDAIDHWLSSAFQTLFALACLGFAIQPLQLGFDPSVHLVPLTLGAGWRAGVAVIGFVCLPVIPAGFSAGMQKVAAGAQVAIDLWRRFKGEKPKDGE